MRMVFIHGINNENNTSAKIEHDWWASIEAGWKTWGHAPKPRIETRAAFYGDILAGEIEAIYQKQGAAEVQATAAAFQFLAEYKEHAGISDDEYARLQQAVAPDFDYQQQGPFRAALVRLADAIAEALPSKGKTVAKLFLQQASTYIDNPGVRENIHQTVIKQAFPNDKVPTIVISHSLGTLVAYNCLFDAKYGVTADGTPVPLCLTLGSPLGIGMMDAVLPSLTKFPTPPLGVWVNGLRKDDFVPLDKTLKEATIGFRGITNIRTLMKDGVDPHSIDEYLRAEQISKVIWDAL